MTIVSVGKTVLWIYFVSAVSTSANENNEKATVRTSDGSFLGKIFMSRQARHYAAFRGIRYGTVRGRFEIAEQMMPLTDDQDALKFGPSCAHINGLTGVMVSKQEDCLFLNVYTPKRFTNITNLPVMFWVHGGSFTDGAGSDYAPDYFMDEDVVLVTANYRLGVFGFLHLGDTDMPANNGLKDLILALKWVQRNIAGFGGDPDKVTVFGASSGAATVHLLVLSPAAKGLFSGAILQSGSALCPWAMTRTPDVIVAKLAEQLGCPTRNSVEILQCLKEMAVENVLNAQRKIMETEMMLFGPTIESDSGRFFDRNYPAVPASPFELLSEYSNNNRSIPIMIGINAREGIFSSATSFLTSSSAMSYLSYNWASLSAKMFKYDDYVPHTDLTAFSESLLSLYFESKDISMETRDALIDLTTDFSFGRGARLATELHSYHGSPVFSYVLIHRGDYSVARIFGLNLEGPGHADDLQYLFPSRGEPPLYPDLKRGSLDEEFSKKMISLWVSFARTRSPVSWGHKWDPIKAEVLRDVNFPHMLLADEPTVAPLSNKKYQRIIQLDELISGYESPPSSWRAARRSRDEL